MDSYSKAFSFTLHNISQGNGHKNITVFLTPYIKYERNVRNRYCTIEVKLECKGNREKLFLKGINSFRLIFLGGDREEHGVRGSH